MRSIADTNAKTRSAALRAEHHEVSERLLEVLDEAKAHALAGRMDRWAEARTRASVLAGQLALVTEQLAAMEFGRASRGVPSRTSSWAVER